ncbi:iron-hydroxamate ABC transporter substrate-binding protein [Paenibacillus paridis]|uniref:iron-hydroxamate ABC transporter substrate-binding protein n=1 Tax=Paenibacillus paridis TaxID=2583376 RepID=UPI00112013F9|nr:iron-hydroxamate ABC transporter substrate-binding protein [Paenibacillus paridis]
MRKFFIPLVLILGVLVTACSGNQANNANQASNAPSASPEASADAESATVIYQSEKGPVEVPRNPKRVVVLTRFLTGNVMALDVPLVGVDEMSKSNPNFEEQLKDVEAVSDESLEKILELQPDLIIGLSDIQNIDKFEQIAPTVTYTYNKLNYLEQQLEVGKLLNKEKEAQAWVNDFQVRTQKAGEEIRAKIGENATVSVIETFNKQLYVYGYNFGRGTELLYGDLKFAMPQKVEEGTKTEGYLALSTEVLNDYLGDYVIFSKDADEDNSFQDTQVYKSLPVVQNNHVFEVDAKRFYFNDPLSLEYQLDVFIEHFIGKE